jgi:hypothetical protein
MGRLTSDAPFFVGRMIEEGLIEENLEDDYDSEE